MSNDNYLYEGYWKDGKYHGKGKLVFSNGVFKEGNFLAGKM